MFSRKVFFSLLLAVVSLGVIAAAVYMANWSMKRVPSPAFAGPLGDPLTQQTQVAFPVVNTSGTTLPVINGNTGAPMFIGSRPWVIAPDEAFTSYDWGADHFFVFGGVPYHYIGSVATSGAFNFFLVQDWTVSPLAFNPLLFLGQGDAYNCPDFASQADAQAVLRADPSDPNGLDGNDNGIACENNPPPTDFVRVPRR